MLVLQALPVIAANGSDRATIRAATKDIMELFAPLRGLNLNFGPQTHLRDDRLTCERLSSRHERPVEFSRDRPAPRVWSGSKHNR